MSKTNRFFYARTCIVAGALLLLAIGAWQWNDGTARRFIASHAQVTMQPLSVYEWRDVRTLQTAAYAQGLAWLHHNGYGTIFVAYNRGASEADPNTYGQSLQSFVAMAKANDMRAGLIAGDPSWALPGNDAAALQVLSFVRAYNAASEWPLSAVQFDIEPYVQGASTSATARELTALVQKVNGSAAASNDTFSIGYTVPFWLANDTSDTTALIQATAQRAHSFLSVMDYRRNADGANGSIAHAQSFLALASRFNTRIILALDAADSSPRSTTFFGTSLQTLRLAQYRLDQAERAQRNYAGQAVNDLQSVTSLPTR